MTLTSIDQSFKQIKTAYDRGGRPLSEICDLTCAALGQVQRLQLKPYAHSTKDYIAYAAERNISRPVLVNRFLRDPRQFRKLWDKFINSLDPAAHTSSMEPDLIDQALYTSTMAFAVCYDLWKPKSRKTPGTYFEVVIGSILGHLLPDMARTKHISLPDCHETVSTDIVFANATGGLVVPTKTTTRERIVQPYAHQRILNSVFPDGRFRSVLMCVSETQRDDSELVVKEICVPGTIRLFQLHLSALAGIYYLDPPDRYLAKDVIDILTVGRTSKLLREDLPVVAAATI